MKKLTILLAAIALVCFSVPAMAVDWNFYGSARMATFYTSEDLGAGLNAAGNDSDDGIDWDLQGNSRLGATVKAENVSGRFELGLKAGDLSVDGIPVTSQAELIGARISHGFRLGYIEEKGYEGVR